MRSRSTGYASMDTFWCLNGVGAMILFTAFLSAMLQLSNPSPGQTNTLRECLLGKAVPASYPTSPGFAELALPFNRRFSYTPVAIATPLTSTDVANSVSCARLNGVKVQARSGGHAYAAYSLGGKNGSLVIDLRNFKSVDLDEATAIATVGAGLTLGELGPRLYEQGKRAVPYGTSAQ